MTDAYILDAVRTPIGKLGGTLSAIRADDLAALPIRTLVERNGGVDPLRIDDVLLGCANQAGEDNRNVARMALLLAGLPVTVPGETINRLCASGMSAAVTAARAIRCGHTHLYVAGGVEHMTRAPYAMSKPSAAFGRDARLYDTSLGWRFVNPLMEKLYGIDSMGHTAENVAEQFEISRDDQDAFAVRSQAKAEESRRSERLGKEIVPVRIPQRRGDDVVFDADEFPRAGTTIETLAKLRPAFRTDGKGSVTAGNSSGLNDGACAMLVGSEEAAKAAGLTPRVRIVAAAVVGVEPRIMGMGPVEASRKALVRAGLEMTQMDVIELNEAFAAQSLACLRQLGVPDDDPRVNPNGGAIALGHPLGMSGARLLHTAMLELEQRKARYALCTMCVGVGQGMATILERAGAE